MESCSSLVSRKGECSKPIFQILVYYINCFTLVFHGFDFKPYCKARNEFNKQVNGLDFKPYVSVLNLFFKY